MKFVLFVEGHTEKKAVPALLKRWLDARLDQKVGIKPVRFDGWAEMVKDLPIKVPMHLHGPGSQDTLAVIGLLDLYGPTFYPPGLQAAEARRSWATGELHKRVDDPRFRMFFAVHEVEAWLLSDPNLLPADIKNALPGAAQKPETVNFDEPPAMLLDWLYCEKQHKHYKKTVDGVGLFNRLDPNLVYQKCPGFAQMLDVMLALAREAGL